MGKIFKKMSKQNSKTVKIVFFFFQNSRFLQIFLQNRFNPFGQTHGATDKKFHFPKNYFDFASKIAQNARISSKKQENSFKN